MNILVLHKLGNPVNAPHFLVRHVFSLKNNFPGHNYIYHDCHLSIPIWLKDFEFDAIILDVTLLCARWSPQESYRKTLQDLDFVRTSNAFKIAMPQDEYDCNEVLDKWMVDWRIDVVYSVLSENHDLIYPEYHKTGVIKMAFTGYLDESSIEVARKSFHSRRIDIGYRARKLPAYFGRIGSEKEQVGLAVAKKAADHGLNIDIKIGVEHSFHGIHWLNFLGESKFTLGSNSGSSLLDPVGAIRRKVYDYVWRHPEARFEDIEAACFPGLDGKQQFTAISPRIMEAAVMDSCQILVPGHYSGIFSPWEHYIPIAADARDFDEVRKAMADDSLVLPMIARARDAILSHPQLRYSHQAAAVLETIEARHRSPSNMGHEHFAAVLERYRQDVSLRQRWLYVKQGLRSRAIAQVDRHPRLGSLLRSLYHRRP
jgi:hypothetical protein